MVGEAVMRELHKLDQVAYVRFASVYRSFQDVGEFMRELQDLVKEGQRSRRGAARQGHVGGVTASSLIRCPLTR